MWCQSLFQQRPYMTHYLLMGEGCTITGMYTQFQLTFWMKTGKSFVKRPWLYPVDLHDESRSVCNTGCANKSAPWRNIIITNISHKFWLENTFYLVSPISSSSNKFYSIKFEDRIPEIWSIYWYECKLQCGHFSAFSCCLASLHGDHW